ncbi:acyl-CoA dehydrogenase family protein [Pseudoglutamicibacter cumminsii]|uniref:Acyl-CoA dehydrogenase n=1 Tax=Pseudoglutamicibacter cumminsii TaxID=156979 RepID=A0ABX5L710_9MICC|nr:acyl-CoA dehydrogenase family protein [Pseudoglutamicibacter cumminsii]PWI28654.1 acyl-CoA dehydrogenase [Pseudoglutamicibacter cumminsii]
MSDRVTAILTPGLLATLRERAPELDQNNEFAFQDVHDLAEAGYFTATLPIEEGGAGWTFADLVRAERLLAAAAPATALAVNMHQVWCGVDMILRSWGDERLAFMRNWVAEGELLAFGVSEPGNDAVLLDSYTEATPVDGGYSLNGLKVFTSLGPAWTRLGVMGKHDGKLLYGFVEPQDGVQRVGEWDALGMRASGSFATKLTDAFMKEDTIHTRFEPWDATEPLVSAIFASFLTLTGSVYVGIADRALELARQSASERTSRSTGLALSQQPAARAPIAEAGMKQIALDAVVESVVNELDGGLAPSPETVARWVTLRTMATDIAQSHIETARALSGGAGFTRTSEISRLYRDIAAGIHHPSQRPSAMESVANWLVGPVEHTANS